VAIYCSKCGKQHPDDANFCMGCGQPFKAGRQSIQAAPMRWEYKDVIIQFPQDRFSGIKTSKSRLYDEVAQLGDSIILARLQREGHDGWQVEGSTDFRTLDRLNRIQKQSRTPFGFPESPPKITYEQVTIRLRRLIS